MSLILGIAWLSPAAFWAWAAGMTMGGFLGTLLGQWMTLLIQANPVGWVVRQYRALLGDIRHLLVTGELRAGR